MKPLSYCAGFVRNSRGKQLFYSMLEATPAAQPDAWIVCSPLLEEGVAAHDTLRNFARALARNSVRVYRFDYEGCGDSGGEALQLGLHDWAADIRDMIAFARIEGAARIHLLGIRGGALTAAIAAALDSGVHHLWTLCPVTDGESHLQEFLRINLSTQLVAYNKVLHNRDQLMAKVLDGGTVNLQGWEVGAAFVETLRRANLETLVKGLSIPITNIAAPAPGSLFWLDPRTVDFDQKDLQASLLSQAFNLSIA